MTSSAEVNPEDPASCCAVLAVYHGHRSCLTVRHESHVMTESEYVEEIEREVAGHAGPMWQNHLW